MYAHTSAMPRIEDVRVVCYEPVGGTSTVTAIHLGTLLTIQFHRREEAVAWVEHVAATMAVAIREAEAAELAVDE